MEINFDFMDEIKKADDKMSMPDLEVSKANANQLRADSSKADGNNSRPGSQVSKADGNQLRPSSQSSKAGFNRSRPVSQSSKAGFNGSRPVSQSSKAGFNGSRPLSQSSKAGFNGSRPASGMSKAEGKRSRPVSASLKSAIKIYSGLRFFEVKRPSSRSSIKSSITNKVRNNTKKLPPTVVKLSRSNSNLGSTTNKLGSNASMKLGSITSRLSSNTSKLKQLPPIKVEQRHIDFRTEVNFLFTCDLCSEDDKNIPANGFCIVCNQYMCAECLTFHQRVNATKSHPILIGDDLQNTTKKTEQKTRSNCSSHPGEVQKYFCHDHNACICEKCKFIAHAKCDNIATVSELATGMHKSEEAKVILDDIDDILSEFQHLKQARERDLNEIQAQKDEIINSVNTTRRKINELLDKIESDTLQNFNSAIDAEINKMQKQTETFDNVIPLLQAQKDEILHLKEKEAEEELFLAIKTVETDIKRYCDVLVETHKDSYKFNMKFEVSETLKEFYQTLDSLGQVRLRKMKTGCILPSLSFRPHSEREALFAGEVNIYFQTDTAIPSIYKMIELPDGSLLFSDFTNKKLKLYDHTHKAVCEMTLTSEPKGMTFMSTSEVIVALNDVRYLQKVFLDKEAGLILGRKCFTKLFCIDLISYERDIIALAENKSRFFINLMDIKGHDKKCIRRESKKTGIFTNLMYITRNKAVLYVSDSVSGCFAISLSGEILFHVSDISIDDNRDICVNPEGGLYIVGCHSNNIVLFSNKGRKVKAMIDKNLTSPSSVCYSAIRNQLIISYIQAHTVKLFTLL